MSHPALMAVSLMTECSGSYGYEGTGGAPIRTPHASTGRESGHLPSEPEPELAERIQQAIRQSGYLRLRHISIQVEEGTVWLSGEVDSYYLKQLAQQKAMSVDGVRQIVNELHVS